MAILNELISRSDTKMKPEYKKARESFWEYCKLMNPKFFHDDRAYQVEMAETLQALCENRIIKLPGETDWKVMSEKEIGKRIAKQPLEKRLKYEVCDCLMLNIPPRHGKSYMVTLFCQWLFGKSNENRIITVSYNEILSGRFSSGVRDGIDAEKLDDSFTVFSDIFPETRIKYGDASKQIWSLEGQFFSYLGTGLGGTITGIGCGIGIIDDPIKNSMEAYNPDLLDSQFSWYTDTFLSRIEEGGKQIIIMTRWSTKDLCGQLLASENAGDWYVLKMSACLSEEKKQMLCQDVLSYKSYRKKRNLMSADIADANYQQEPVDSKDRMYLYFQEYDTLPEVYEVKHVCDTADTGKDYLCSIVYAETKDKRRFVLPYPNAIIYTQAPQEKTEIAVAEQLRDLLVNVSVVESNNGGRAFARNVERITKAKGNRRTRITWFHQNKNKEARILSGSTLVQQTIFYPRGWQNLFPDYSKAMRGYKKIGKNDHDDAADCTTMIVEDLHTSSRISFD